MPLLDRPGTANAGGPSSLLLSVSGQVRLVCLSSLLHWPHSPPRRQTQVVHGENHHPTPGVQSRGPFESLPRTFSQNFILVPAPDGPSSIVGVGVPYLIMTDAYRFV